MVYKQKDKRKCTIHLCRRDLFLGIKVAWHWALKFVWEDGYTETYEANKSRGGMLKLQYKEGEPEKIYDWEPWKVYPVARSFSPSEVMYQAERLFCVDNKYRLIFSNCQDFAESLAKKFGVRLHLGIFKVFRTVATLGLDNIIQH
ncbi:unnamed protein product [Meganyctiphanes norvegica]|uniref:LRAT domain-containing protein n=1 Tax=Meganyctiphanes norvegica TaxID=48144 RepID=A0AAV2RSV2_MEGNR